MPLLTSLALGGTCIGLYFTYIYTGAEDLRSKVYEPLFSEISKLESLAAVDSLQPFLGSTMDNLVRSGSVERLPKYIRHEITAVYQDFSGLQRDKYSVAEIIQRSMSAQIATIRTEADDKAWALTISKKLRAESNTKPGITAIATFHFTHAARGRGIDVRDPSHPVVASPGGPNWTLNDWAAYPQSAVDMEKIWTDDDYLYFDPSLDDWYYRITRSDLRNHRIDLRTFLAATAHRLWASPEYQHLVVVRPRVEAAAKALAQKLAQRIQQPKELVDLFR